MTMKTKKTIALSLALAASVLVGLAVPFAATWVSVQLGAVYSFPCMLLGLFGVVTCVATGGAAFIGLTEIKP